MKEPAWLREFQRLLPLKTQFILYGNTVDCFPVLSQQQTTSSQVRFAQLAVSLPAALKYWGYQVVGIHDLVDGLRFVGGNDEISRQRTEFCRAIAYPDCPKAADSESVDVPGTLSRIRRAVRNPTISCAFLLESAFLLSKGPNDLDEAESGPVSHRLKVWARSGKGVRRRTSSAKCSDSRGLKTERSAGLAVPGQSALSDNRNLPAG